MSRLWHEVVTVWLFAVVAVWSCACGRSNLDVPSLVLLPDATSQGLGSSEGAVPDDGSLALLDASSPAHEDAFPAPEDAPRSPEDAPLSPPPSCGGGGCAGGCCDGTGCRLGTAPTACGFGAQACTDCTALGLVCVPALDGGGGGICGVGDAGQTSEGGSPCGPSNCAGCCAGNFCVPGTTSGSCGSHGQACALCSASNEACVSTNGGGLCVGRGSSCNVTNCSGCCDANGVCQDPTAIDACGIGGVACQFCLPGQACNSGQCQTTSGCGPANCVGCCQGNTCLNGTDHDECGANGAACMSCTGGLVCNPLGAKGGGQCSNGNSCGGQCNGCCDLFLECQAGTSSTYCGAGAGPCGTCSGSCTSGRCDGQKCDASNCSGCCMPDGTCFEGPKDGAHCGGDGRLCFNCGPGYACDDNWVCQIACSPENCTGCCVGGICTTGTDPTSCGLGGNLCAQCTPDQSCVNGTCLKLTQCGPTLCAGCCQNFVCLIGDTDTACGSGGSACSDCTTSGQSCIGTACSP